MKEKADIQKEMGIVIYEYYKKGIQPPILSHVYDIAKERLQHRQSFSDDEGEVLNGHINITDN